MYDWVPSLFSCNCYHIVTWSYPRTKGKVKKKDTEKIKCMEKLLCTCRYDDVSLGTRASVLMVLTDN